MLLIEAQTGLYFGSHCFDFYVLLVLIWGRCVLEMCLGLCRADQSRGTSLQFRTSNNGPLWNKLRMGGGNLTKWLCSLVVTMDLKEISWERIKSPSCQGHYVALQVPLISLENKNSYLMEVVALFTQSYFKY